MSYIVSNGALQHLDYPSSSVVTIGDALTLEFKRLHIVSRKFDVIGCNEILLASYVRSSVTKERSLQCVSYYTETAQPVGHRLRTPSLDNCNPVAYRTLDIDTFDPTDYGNPCIYHTPGYTGSPITVSCQVHEYNSLRSIYYLGGLLQVVSKLAGKFNPIFQIAGDTLGSGLTLFKDKSFHRTLMRGLTLLIQEGSPLGTYVFIPGILTLPYVERVRAQEHYILTVDNVLVHKDTQEEYSMTYYVIQASNRPRPDLKDFNVEADSAEIVSKLKSDVTLDQVQSTVDMIKSSHTAQALDNMIDAVAARNEKLAKAYKNHLPADWLSLTQLAM